MQAWNAACSQGVSSSRDISEQEVLRLAVDLCESSEGMLKRGSRMSERGGFPCCDRAKTYIGGNAVKPSRTLLLSAKVHAMHVQNIFWTRKSSYLKWLDINTRRGNAVELQLHRVIRCRRKPRLLMKRQAYFSEQICDSRILLYLVFAKEHRVFAEEQ